MRSRIGLYLAFAVMAAVMAGPFYWALITSLKPASEISAHPPGFWPDTPTLDAYREVLSGFPYGRFLLNSLLVSGIATVIQITFALLMAYAFAAIRFPHKGLLLGAVLATLMIPDELKLIPNFVLVNRLGWQDTYAALIIPPAANAFPVFVFYQHFRTLPPSLLEAGKMEGAGHGRILWSLYLPLSLPVLAAAGVVAFLGRWNDYLWPLLVTDSASMRTLPLGLAYLKSDQESGLAWNSLMAGTVLGMIPLLILVVAAERRLAAGLRSGFFH